MATTPNTTALRRNECYAGPDVIGLVVSQDFACPDRYYCPNTTASNPASRPQICPPTSECSTYRLNNLWCPSQGIYEPIVCPRGSYCPDTRTILPCPSGYFCPAGSMAPRSCGAINVCHEGSGGRTEITSIIILFIIDAIVFNTILLLKWRGRRIDLLRQRNLIRRVKTRSAIEEGKGGAEIKDVEVGSTTVSAGALEEAGDMSRLIRGFQRANPASGSDAADLARLTFTFKNLGLTLPSGKRILRGVTGALYPGRFTAIMGPSGAGKTTFLNVLLGKVDGTEGSVSINGIRTKIQRFKKLVGYVPQEDVMLRELSAREIISHSAHVRLPRSWSKAEANDYVDAVLEALNLTEVAATPVGDETTRGLSGGQRKRVNIGIELAAVPYALFLDEPTSGLDATAALDLAHTLRNIARVGLTIVSVIHQPRYEIFQAFDDVLLIAPGGFTCYHGPVDGAIRHFEDLGFYFDPRANPADILMDILSGQGTPASPADIPVKRLPDTEEMSRIWEKVQQKADNDESPSSPLYPSGSPGEENESHEVDVTKENTSSPTASLTREQRSVLSAWSNMVRDRGASIPRQIILCHSRSVLQQYRRSMVLAFEYGVAAIAGVLLAISVMGQMGELYIGALLPPYATISVSPLEFLIPQMCMLACMSIVVSGSPAAVRTFGEEKTVYWREAASGHNRFAYFSGKSISTVYRFALGALHYTAFYHTISRTDPSLSALFPLILLQYFCVYGASEIISIIVSRANGALLASIACLIIAVCNGYGPNLNQASNWGLRWFWDMSYSRWFSEAYYSEYISPYTNLYQTDTSAGKFGYTLGRYSMGVALTFVIGVILKILGFIALISTNRKHQR